MQWKNLIPFGLGQAKPHHFRDMAGVVWKNRDSLPYAWNILNRGVCDGCSLGPYGLKDNVIKGTHLCMTRLNLLRLNTMPLVEEGAFADVEHLRSLSNEQLHQLGRLPFPMVLEPGGGRFRRATWEQALDVIAEQMQPVPVERMAFFATSRGLTNEAYYTFQKLPRMLGTNNVDLCARLCHSASVYGLKQALGIGSPTCSLSDFIGTELLVLFGTDLANNQPVSTKYMHYAREAGTRIVVINPYREPGLERYWVPSVAKSAVFGTKLMDDFFQVKIGGDIAFINGVMKSLIAEGMEDKAFIAQHVSGFAETRQFLEGLAWEDIERSSGVERAEIIRFARMYGTARSAVLCYSMGLTQHTFGVENVRSIANLALVRGNLGREKCGIMPIRGHSGVQGGGECGVDPEKFPGGYEINPENAQRFARLWGKEIPDTIGYRTGQMVDAAHQGKLDVLYTIGGNLIETMPDPEYVKAALRRVKFRIHQDIVLNTYSLFDSGGMLVLLPAQTRYESGGTSTSTERRVRYSPRIAKQAPGETRAEWEIPCLIGKRLLPAHAAQFSYASEAEVRAEIARAMPMYAGIEQFTKAGDFIQWGGKQLFAEGFTKMPQGRAQMSPVAIPRREVPAGKFYFTTRRGKQFNSITFGAKDPLTGSRRRDDVFISPADAKALGIADGEEILVRSALGEMRGHARFSDIREGNLQAYWPEGNVLIERRYDPVSNEPDYNAVVEVHKACGA